MSDESVSLSCSLKIAYLDGQGVATRQLSNPKSHLVLGRNEFRDIILRVEVGGATKISFGIRSMELHTRFVKEGKASISLKEEPRAQIFISNCPTEKLGLFLKTLMAKVERLKGARPTGVRERLLSERTATFEEISPLTTLDLNALRAKRQLPPTQSPTSTKRPRCSDQPSQPLKRVARPMSSMLTLEQRGVLEAVLSGRNVFFTGSAGTGKSFLLRRILGALAPEGTFATASTGMAACHIGGMTLHAFAGIGGGEVSVEQCARRGLWRQCRRLVVDEVSMVDGRLFGRLEAVARALRRSDRPFGGIQLILSGDFLQLPPVTPRGTERQFCFQSPAWEKCIDVNIELSQVKRQKDQKFIDILQKVRRGRLTGDALETLRSTCKQRVERDGILATKLSTHKDDVELINKSHLDALTGDVHVFEPEDSNPSLSQQGGALQLKVGAQVMLTRNLDVARGLVNGARGVVTDFNKDGVPVVQFACGVHEAVGPERWTMRAPGSGALLQRKMIPLQLAWAMSIHKSQGMTLDCVEVSLGRVFECGQAYVALSRARSLQGLRVLDMSERSIRADPQVLRFYAQLQEGRH